MKLRISADAEGMYWRGGVSIEVAEPIVRAFEPIRTCDDAMTCLATGDVMASSEVVQTKLKLRKESAKEIADILTRHLIEEMSKNDTHNGY